MLKSFVAECLFHTTWLNCTSILIGQRYFWPLMREDIREKHACSFLIENPALLVGYEVEKRHFFSLKVRNRVANN